MPHFQGGQMYVNTDRRPIIKHHENGVFIPKTEGLILLKCFKEKTAFY